MDLETVRAAVNDIERDLKKLRNKIAYREKVVADTLGEIAALRVDEERMTGRYIDLVTRERELKEGRGSA
jgi:hypothetical protein